jgi:sulfatase maturation enzyme AslB (radical SAM superfamily)
VALSELVCLHNDFVTAFEKRTDAIDVALTGGEPLLRADDTVDLLKAFVSHSSRRRDDRISLNTNGTLLNSTIADRLCEIPGLHVWISIDGDEAHHNALRGAGTYSLAYRAIEILVARGVWCGAALFPCESNLHTMEQAARSCFEIGASQFAVQFPMCVGRWRDHSISSYLSSFYEELLGLHSCFGDRVLSPLASIREYGSLVKECPVGKNITFHVMPDGSIFPCYSLVGTQFSIGTIWAWPRTPTEFNRTLSRFQKHRTFIDTKQVGCLVGCPAALSEGSQIPESWISFHKELLRLSDQMN